MKRSYPLEPVEMLRETRADAKAREASRAAARVLQTRAEEARAKEAVDRARVAREVVELEARQRLETGIERVVDLERSFVFAARGRAREGELEAKRQLLARQASEAERLRALALASLSTAHAELASVERHHARWDASREREQQEKEQEAALEQWNNERSRRSSGP